MTQSVHKVVVFGLCVVVALFIASPVQGEEKVKLTGDEIKEFTKPGCITFGIDEIMDTIWICEVLDNGTRRAFWRNLKILDVSGEITDGTIKVVGDQECSRWMGSQEYFYDIYRIGKDKYQSWSGNVCRYTWYRVQNKCEPKKDKVKLKGNEIKEITTTPGRITFGIDNLMDTFWIIEVLEDGTRRCFWRTLADLDITGEATKGTIKVVGDQDCPQWGSGPERCYDIYRIGKDKYQSWRGDFLRATWYLAR